MSNDTVAIALELYTRRFSTLDDSGEGAACYRYERNTEAEKVIEALRKFFKADKGGSFDEFNLAYDKLERALSALDRRDGR